MVRPVRQAKTIAESEMWVEQLLWLKPGGRGVLTERESRESWA